MTVTAAAVMNTASSRRHCLPHVLVHSMGAVRTAHWWCGCAWNGSNMLCAAALQGAARGASCTGQKDGFACDTQRAGAVHSSCGAPAATAATRAPQGGRHSNGISSCRLLLLTVAPSAAGGGCSCCASSAADAPCSCGALLSCTSPVAASSSENPSPASTATYNAAAAAAAGGAALRPPFLLQQHCGAVEREARAAPPRNDVGVPALQICAV